MAKRCKILRHKLIEALDNLRVRQLGDENLKFIQSCLVVTLLRTQQEMAKRGLEVQEACMPRCAYFTSDGKMREVREI